jgi:uncharacterized membrane protein
VAQTFCAFYSLSLSLITHTQKQANKGELAVEMFLFVLVISLINMEKRNSEIGFSVSFSSSVWRAPVNCNSQRRKIHTDRQTEYKRESTRTDGGNEN